MSTRPSFAAQITGLPANFWYANIMETLERLAFFAVVAIRSLYVVAGAGEKGLGLSYSQRGAIFGIWALLQCLIPMVSGGYTDRYGYRKSLAVAFVINILGYVLMANSYHLAGTLGTHGWAGAGFWVFLAASCLVGTGTAVFKPAVQGTVARSSTDATSSIAWGVFYWVVNIGGMLAPFAAAWARGKTGTDWSVVFYGAAAVTALNFLPAFLLYREPPPVESPDGKGETKGPLGVFASSVMTVFTDLRFVVFLLIFSCFWLMFMQLWDLLPNFIDEWVNTADVAPFYHRLGSGMILESGQVKPEMIINIDAFAIVLLVIPISWMISRLNKIVAMVTGMFIALVAFVAAGATSIGWFCCLMIFVFAIGEMICSPTFTAYVGLIAPPHKKALYMGYSNIPFAIGWSLGSFVAGAIYDHTSSKANLARDYLVHTYALPAALVDNHAAFPNDEVVPALAYLHNGGDAETVRGAVQSLIDQRRSAPVTLEQVKAAFAPIKAKVDQPAVLAVTKVLWDKYNPKVVWFYLGGIGLIGTLGMMIFYLATRRPAAGAPETTTAT